MMCFGEYGLAMERKLVIAEYHFGELVRAPRQPDDQGLPPIPLQAHFEAAGRAVASMPDQLASGIADALVGAVPQLPPPSNAYLHTVQDALDDGPLQSLVAELTGDVRYKDLRSWRNRATHRFDTKKAMDGVWIVAPPDGIEPFVEPRDVDSYVAAMLAFGRHILDRAPAAEAFALRLNESVRRIAR